MDLEIMRKWFKKLMIKLKYEVDVSDLKKNPGIPLFQAVAASMADTSPKEPHLLIKNQPTMVLHRQFYLWMMSDALLD